MTFWVKQPNFEGLEFLAFWADFYAKFTLFSL